MLGFASSIPLALRPLSAAATARRVTARRTFVCALSVPDAVSAAIRNENVMVFSKSGCPYCTQAKAILRDDCGVNPTVWELDQMENGFDVQAELLKITGQRTVPNIFIGEEHVGGVSG